MVKVVFLPWYNAYRFLVQSARRWEADQDKRTTAMEGGDGKKKAAALWRPDPEAAAASPNVLDRWLLASSRELARFVRAEMGAYRLYTVVPRLTRFIADLTNVYVRYNRSRLKGKEDGGSGAAGDDDDDDAAALLLLLRLLPKTHPDSTPPPSTGPPSRRPPRTARATTPSAGAWKRCREPSSSRGRSASEG